MFEKGISTTWKVIEGAPHTENGRIRIPSTAALQVADSAARRVFHHDQTLKQN